MILQKTMISVHSTAMELSKEPENLQQVISQDTDIATQLHSCHRLRIHSDSVSIIQFSSMADISDQTQTPRELHPE
jgi:hypothetical protein